MYGCVILKVCACYMIYVFDRAWKKHECVIGCSVDGVGSVLACSRVCCRGSAGKHSAYSTQHTLHLHAHIIHVFDCDEKKKIMRASLDVVLATRHWSVLAFYGVCYKESAEYGNAYSTQHTPTQTHTRTYTHTHAHTHAHTHTNTHALSL